ncbi:hypothetical protein MMC26_005386 [Xylographa opegraphella]|nr:hypothetical protein [Xylographa opegraphella]
MGSIPETPRPSPRLDTDLEKQELDDVFESPSQGGTTVVADEFQAQTSPKLGIKRSITDYLRKVSLPEKFPEPWRRRTIEPCDEAERIQRIDSHPEGYPQLAAFINSDDNFAMCRRFGFLHQRVLLYRQDELRDLEDQLIRLDDEDKEEMPKALKSRKLDDIREGSYRRGLIQQIDEKLKEYVDVVERIKSLSSYKSASTRDHTSVRNWLTNNATLSTEESEFIHHKSDLIALTDLEEGSWFDGFVEDCLSKIPCRATRLLFTSPEQRNSTQDAYVHLYSKARINILVRLVVCLLAVLLLMVPVVLLLLVPALNPIKIVVIVLFTLFFSLVLSTCTRAKRHDVFGATAA